MNGAGVPATYARDVNGDLAGVGHDCPRLATGDAGIDALSFESINS